MTVQYTLTLAGPGSTTRELLYSPTTSACVWADTGERLAPDLSAGRDWKVAPVVSPTEPGRKSRKVRSLKIQLGLKCNYACSYCNQRAQPHDMQGNPGQVDRFLAKLPTWLDIGNGAGVTIEFWGGEPFVYWKTLQPLAEGVRKLYPAADFNIITNGSLLDDEKIDWLERLGFGVGISHDGPAYEVNRGADPLLIPDQRDMIRKLYDRMRPYGRIGFNAVLTSHNYSLMAVREHIGRHLGVNPFELPLSTEEIVLAYQDDAVELSITDEHKHDQALRTIFWEAVTNHAVSSTTQQKMESFLNSLANGRPASSLGMKCGMDRADNLAFDLNGNVVTCQNTSPLTKHRIGHMEAFDHVRLTTAHHWSTRAECSQCPVVQLCRGACLYLEGELWEHACDTSWTYNLAILAAALFHATKMVLIRIDGPALRRRGVTSEPVIDKQWFEGMFRTGRTPEQPQAQMGM